MQREATSQEEPDADGRYRLLEMLARGGQGDVWRAHDKVQDRVVALKLLNEAAAVNPECVERLRRERAALAALEGTCAVRVVDGPFEYQGAPCVAMEFLDGVDLESRLSSLEGKGTRLSFQEVTQVLEPLVQTLHKAHLLGIVHRDLKPANVFLLRDGGVRLIDFGFARLEFEARMTVFGVVMGSPCYIAPEVWHGHANTSGVSVDIYSLAVIAFRMLGGKPPFETKSLVEMRELATRARRPSLHELRPDLSPAVDRWVQQAMAVDPVDRYPSVRTLWESLCEAVEQPKPSSWSVIPRAFAANFHPKRVAEALRRAGAVLWGTRPSTRQSDPDLGEPKRAAASGERPLGAPRVPRFERPKHPPAHVRAAQQEPEPVSEPVPISAIPLSAGPVSSRPAQVSLAHTNTAQAIQQRTERRKKTRRRASKQTRKARQKSRRVRRRKR